MKKKDILLIICLLLLSCAPTVYYVLQGSLADSSQTYAVITVDGSVYKTVPLGSLCS